MDAIVFNSYIGKGGREDFQNFKMHKNALKLVLKEMLLPSMIGVDLCKNWGEEEGGGKLKKG